MKQRCPFCNNEIVRYRNPIPTVDIIIESDSDGIILIKRKNEPIGWALPGGFVDYGESLEDAAIREAKEETSLDVTLISQFHTYSNPDRDPRHHTVSTIFIARATGKARADDDAADIGYFTRDSLPDPIVFDHRRILDDYFTNRFDEK
ncbi:MAG: NUDIX hydrolase [Deltaproteobacteria bacterium]|nr:NUDIX hydrolase [Deltaproteobacteria bacterium]MBN2687545.1 NUDIX hydrolase [Deltaproteobacteria bacterium]